MTFSYSQGLTLSIPNKQAYKGETVACDILTIGFDSIVSAQFSISWNPDIIRFDESELIDLDLVATGISDASTGSINISWFDIDGEGKSLSDGQTFLRLHFTAVGEIGDISPINIQGDSLQIQVFKATPIPLQFEEVALIAENGSVEIVEEDPQNSFEITDINIENLNCFGDTDGAISLSTNQENVSYSWSGPNGFSSSELIIENLVAGEYIFTVFDDDGVVIFTNTYIVAGPAAELNVAVLEIQASSCAEATGSVQIDVEGGTAPYEFILDNQDQFSTGNISSLASGIYPVTISDANDCIIETTFEIPSEGSFAFSLGNDIEACNGQIVSLSAGVFEAYSWSNGASTQEVDIDQAGEYIVTVTNDTGCSAIDTILVNYIDQIQLQIAETDIMICPGDSIELAVSGGVNYEWIDPNNELTDTQGSTILVHPNENTIYTVISEGDCGADELEIPVELFQSTATAGEDMCIAEGESVTLDASGGAFYYWSGSEYPLNAYDIPNPTASPADSTRYFVMIIDDNNCATFDTVSVFIANDPASFIPHINMITPNGDGQNDVLDFGDIDKFGTNNIRVFNRWGNIVYEKLNYQTDRDRFDGTFKGKPLPAGNYYYVLSFRNDQQIKQTLTIARDD